MRAGYPRKDTTAAWISDLDGTADAPAPGRDFRLEK